MLSLMYKIIIRIYISSIILCWFLSLILKRLLHVRDFLSDVYITIFIFYEFFVLSELLLIIVNTFMIQFQSMLSVHLFLYLFILTFYLSNDFISLAAVMIFRFSKMTLKGHKNYCYLTGNSILFKKRIFMQLHSIYQSFCLFSWLSSLSHFFSFFRESMGLVLPLEDFP